MQATAAAAGASAVILIFVSNTGHAAAGFRNARKSLPLAAERAADELARK
jgi:hypothetical protein